ncbi:MAG: non-canonical purine NTP pyrophosphatase [Candidatus Nealsonbacteria bacterium]|nr:non-canonical purine NTP pyrophosphatase [Candidatus Nealsonbacteria bacterium]
MKLLIATHNKGKLLEYQLIFKEFLPELAVLALSDLNIKEKAPEDGATFEENAVQKAKFYSGLANLPTLADDGGLEIDYLNGEPGVKSRRWPGYEASDEELVKMALEKLKGIPFEKRGARLRAVAAFALPKEKVFTFEGILNGFITEKPINIIPGYPFRAIFYLPDIKKVLGELTMEEEAVLAHRRKAVEAAIPIIKKHLTNF